MIFAERFASQGLAGPPQREAAGVAKRLLAVQGQDPRGARLAIRARSDGLSASDVDRALTEERSLLITWLNRGTLHLVRSEDYPWLHALTTPPLFTSAKRAARQEGVSPDAARARRGDDRAGARRRGPADPRRTARAARVGRRADGGPGPVHLLFLASLRGIAVRGPMVGKQHAYVLVRDWLGAAEPVDRDMALAELARRYLVGHAPADDRDLARWAGLPLRDARAGLRRSPPSWSSARTAWSTWPARRPGPSARRRACSAPSTRCCSAGPRASRSSALTHTSSR